MNKICIVTDDNSGFNIEEANKLGIKIIKMPIIIDSNIYYENESISKEEFFNKLYSDSNISTSQPSPGSIISLWDELLKNYDYILHIPMSSGLSTSCETATNLALDYNDKVLVVNNHRISVTLKQSIYDAITLINKGLDFK